MPTSSSNAPRSRSRTSLVRLKSFSHAATYFRHNLSNIHPAWFLSSILLLYILFTRLTAPPAVVQLITNPDDTDTFSNSAPHPDTLPSSDDVLRRRRSAAAASHSNSNSNSNSSTVLGNHFCILQPTLSAGRSEWLPEHIPSHIALRAFMRTFASTVTDGERKSTRFSIYYGHDSDDPVFGNLTLRNQFATHARLILSTAGFQPSDVALVFTPLYSLHGRINAIWNNLARDAYYDGCDYFFLSNDDMVIFTKSWVSSAIASLNGIGAPPKHKRPCRYFGIVRFKDEWASWATFTFHVATRLHLEIFGGVYYPIPYNSAHNDYWIHNVYGGYDASKYRSEVRVRNRVDDVDYALAHPKDRSKVAPPRYLYDKRGDAKRYILQGRARLHEWLEKYRHSPRCQPPL